jgi:hypothetical protein
MAPTRCVVLVAGDGRGRRGSITEVVRPTIEGSTLKFEVVDDTTL